jgi:hypothetical protein
VGDSPGHRDAIPQKDFVPRLGAGCLVLIGVVIILLGISAAAGPWSGLEGLLFALALGGGFSTAGLFWYRYVAAQERVRTNLFEEKTLLAVALNHGGYATVAQMVLETPYTAAEAEEAMARLCRQGLAHPELLEDGTVRYRFGGLLGEQ